MSFPNIPNILPSMNIMSLDAISLLLSSIALEELSLAHLVNAEAEKIQYVLGTLSSSVLPPLSGVNVADILEVNQDVRKTLTTTIQKEMLTQFQLENIIDLLNSGEFAFVALAEFLAALVFQAVNQFCENEGGGSIFVSPVFPDSFVSTPIPLCGLAGLIKTEVFGYAVELESFNLVALRGTQTAEDALSDADTAFINYFDSLGPIPPPSSPPPPGVSYSSVLTYQGYFNIYTLPNLFGDLSLCKTTQSLREQLFTALSQLNPNKPLILTGHSLGAGLATIIALDLATVTSPPNPFPPLFTNPIMINFASPMVGNIDFVNLYNAKINTSVRVVNTLDVITTQPNIPAGYVHVKSPFNITINGVGSPPGECNHEISSAYFPGLVQLNPFFAELLCTRNPCGFCPPLECIVGKCPQPCVTKKDDNLEEVVKSKNSEV